MIGNLIYRLLQHPDDLFGTNAEDAELHGVAIAKNTKVLCTFGAANLDPEFWDVPQASTTP